MNRPPGTTGISEWLMQKATKNMKEQLDSITLKGGVSLTPQEIEEQARAMQWRRTGGW